MLHRKYLASAVLVVAISASAGGQRSPNEVGGREVNLYARLLAMTDTRQLDTSLVDRALAAKWRPLRAAGTVAIGQIGPDKGMAGARRLRALLTDRDVT